MKQLRAQNLTKTAFADFGEVIETDGAQSLDINYGLATRFLNLCKLDIKGAPQISIFRTNPLPLPHRVNFLERHLDTSQAFIPTDEIPFLVLVARNKNNDIKAHDLQLFITNGRQGVNLYRGTWHHFQIGLLSRRDFIVIDDGGGGETQEKKVCGEIWIPAINP